MSKVDYSPYRDAVGLDGIEISYSARNQGFTVAPVLTLALGIGAASAVFALIQGCS